MKTRVQLLDEVREFNITRDITQRKQANEALHESERRYRDLFKHAVVGIYRTLPDGRHLEVNPALARMRGCDTSAEFMAHFVDARHPIYVDPAAREKMSHLMREQGYVVRFESESYRRDGTRFWMSETGRAVRDETGQIIAYEGFIEDITERKQAEDALRESEERFRTLVEHAPEAITMLDVDTGLYVDANPMAEALHGLPRDELIGKIGPADLSPEIQLDGRPSSEAAPDYLSRALAGEFPRFEWMHLAPDGQETTCEVSLARLPDPYRNLVRASIFDITERKQAEEALRESEARLSNAAEMAKIGYWVWDDIEDKAIYGSEELAKIYGVASGTEWVAVFSSHAADLEWIHPDDRERFDEAIRTAQETKRGFDIEYRIINTAGEVRHLHSIEEPVLGDRGEIIRSNGIAQDITEQKRAEDQLRQAQKMEAVGQLTGGVAHDFNNLLAVILGNAELLEEELGREGMGLDAILLATARGAELTQRLLAFSRQQSLRPQVIDLGELVSGMSQMLTRTLGATIEIETAVAPDLWIALVDPGQVENALLNLAINARDAMPKGGKLTIECRNAHLDEAGAAREQEAVAGDYVVLAVSDTGCGMSGENQARAFEPFFTTKEVGQGSGLGLSMVYGFAQQSGGHVTIESEEGRGTTVKLHLARAEGAFRPETVRQNAGIPRGRGETILVIEDDDDVRAMAGKMLESMGYRVVAAADAARARSLLERGENVDLVLSDVVLPGGTSGTEFAEEVRASHPDLPIVFMSGYLVEAATRNGLLGSDQVLLSKPFQMEQLAEALREALG